MNIEIQGPLVSISSIVLSGPDTVTYKHGNSDIIEPYYLAEYDFSYIVSRYTENQFLVNDIDNYTKEHGWKSMFPTCVDVDETDTCRYFGSLGNLYFLDVAPGYGTAVVYSESDIPVATITFSNEENKFWKLLYLYVSANTVESINLSYEAWRADKYPYRNRNKYVLRNDYFRDYEINPVNDLGIDKRSGTLLGCRLVEDNKTPILRKKKGNLNNTNYTPKKVYFSGDEVVYNEDNYISVSDHNIGNYPPISKEWILKRD